jgi:hypothetical protein
MIMIKDQRRQDTLRPFDRAQFIIEDTAHAGRADIDAENIHQNAPFSKMYHDVIENGRIV